MKIASAQQNLSSSHLAIEHRAVSERLRLWIDDQPARDDSRDPPRGPQNASSGGSAPATLSPLGQALARAAASAPPFAPPRPSAPPPEAPEVSAIESAMKNADNDPIITLLRTMLERVFGIKVKVFDASELQTDNSASEDLQKISANATSAPRQGWGIEYDYHQQRTEIETTRFAAEGVVRTTDGIEISFRLALEMSRTYSENTDISLRAGDAPRQKDPLLINFGGVAAQLSEQQFQIDLDGDGTPETARFAAKGSGFLVFDQNADGKITSGQEMFGPGSGDGFAELATHDGDHNGWIDENDAIYTRLRVWTKAIDGSDVLSSLKDSKVGAISLARLDTPFAIKDGSNTLLGQVKSSGVYLSDDGKVGTVQQVDLAV